MNKVIAGDYKGKSVTCPLLSKPRIIAAGLKVILIDKDTVEQYEVAGEQSQIDSGSAFNRAVVGTALFGPMGFMAGATAKRKGIHQIAILFKDGKRSLIEVDDRIYRQIMISLF